MMSAANSTTAMHTHAHNCQHLVYGQVLFTTAKDNRERWKVFSFYRMHGPVFGTVSLCSFV